MFYWVMMHLSRSVISFSKSVYYCSKLAMIPSILETSSLYLAMAASSSSMEAEFSASILALKLMNKFWSFSRRAESALTSLEASWARAPKTGAMW